MGLCRQTQDGQTHRPTASRIIASICASCIIARGIHTAQTHEDRRWKIAFSPGSHDDLISVSFSSSDETYIRPFTFISPGSYDIACPLMCVNRREDGPLCRKTRDAQTHRPTQNKYVHVRGRHNAKAQLRQLVRCRPLHSERCSRERLVHLLGGRGHLVLARATCNLSAAQLLHVARRADVAL